MVTRWSRTRTRGVVAASAAAITMAAVALQGSVATAAPPRSDTWTCPTELLEPGTLRFSYATDRSGAIELDQASISRSSKPVIFLRTPQDSDPGGVSRVEFKLDEVDDNVADCSLNPRADESGVVIDGAFFAYDFNGGTARRAGAFSFSQLNTGEHTITTQRTTYLPGADIPTVVYARATFTVTA